MNAQPLRCFLIGADSLLIECGETLLARGHAIAGVITSTPRIARWARDKQLPVHAADYDYRPALEAAPFDYLFAITHLGIIPAEILALPRLGAINFHDGPLPRYAGLNAPVWALIRREMEYGITWHTMTAAVDDGAILKQRRFNLAENEVALTLNTRNFELAIASFGELIVELEQGTIQPVPQDLSARTYFGKYDRPAAACCLDWRRAAVDLDALIRALNFGRYPNPVGSAHFKQGEHMVVVTKAEIVEDIAGGESGTILTIDDERIRVATGNGVLDLLEFVTLTGQPLSLSQLAEQLQLQSGQRLDLLDEQHASRLTQLHQQLVRSENFWTRRLRALNPAAIPYSSANADPHAAVEFGEARIATPAEWRGTPDAAEKLLTTLGVYLARVGEHDTFHVALQDETSQNTLAEIRAWTARHVPLQFVIQPTVDFAEQQQQVAAELAKVRKHVSYFRDCIGRLPELRDQAELVAGRKLPILIDVRDDLESFAPPAGFGLMLVVSPRAGDCRLIYDRNVLNSDSAAVIQQQLQTLFMAAAAQPNQPLSQLEILSADERHCLIHEWNATDVPFRSDLCTHELIEEQARQTPEAVAVVCGNRSLSYAELNDRADRLAAYLREQHVGPDRLVGICLERSVDLVVAVLAVHKAGGAYVPLDPHYPADRVALMIDDAAPPVIITQASLAAGLPPHHALVVRIDADWPLIAEHAPLGDPSSVQSHHLAYVIYTSGSTGKPKGVMIEHRNVINFFKGMDARIPHDSPGVWLAVTSLSFDISVLELLWTLSHGFKVVIHRDQPAEHTTPAISVSPRKMDFSLFYFSAAESDTAGSDKYRLLLEGAKFADTHGFNAVWTPERHFHAFGGLYPNPAVTGAAIAVLTKHVQIRAGSVVVPLHHPIRIAEAWSVVDNLSNGRVAIAAAAGWQPNDFVLMPENFARAKDALFRDVEIIKQLWRGETVAFPGATGAPIEVRTLPRPVQPELPIWITTAGNIDTYIAAGRIGANVLTHLLGQSVDELRPKIAAYRQARAEAGFDPATGLVSLMLHTFVGPDDDAVRELVREPMKQYLGTSLNLLKKYAWAFPAFTRPRDSAVDQGNEFETLTPDEQAAVLEHAFERYYETSGLFGRPETCLAIVEQLKQIGINEIACLIDFGAPQDKVLESLPYLDQVRQMSNPCPLAAYTAEDCQATLDESIPVLIQRHGVTYFQCTPSLARMLLGTDDGRAALKCVQQMYVGGEALPIDLARELTATIAGSVMNMYGPTETTVWSTTQTVSREATSIPIGRPIANTSIYILDRHRQLAPLGAVGELYIGGAGVVRGYLHRAELTAERFLPDPFSTVPGARLYRTGDLARYRADGVIEFLGRVDHQVKIRGHRIELGEIEARLIDHPAVHQAVVVARTLSAGDQRLIAFLTTQGTTPEVHDLRESLRRTLPDFMIPAHFMFLAEMPLTPNGKINRQALPALELNAAATTTAAVVAPGSELESQLVKLWQEVLGREQIGVEDNFFDIGGHSLLVVRLHRTLAAAIEQSVSLTDLYRFPTIRSLAAYLGGGQLSVDVQASTDRGAKRREALQRRRIKTGK